MIRNTVLDPSAVITRPSLEVAVAAGFEPSPPQAIKLAERVSIEAVDSTERSLVMPTNLWVFGFNTVSGL